MMHELDARHQVLAQQTAELRATYTRLRAEADVLRELVLAHQGCACTKVHAYLRDGRTATPA
jgi:hypothetical protein